MGVEAIMGTIIGIVGSNIFKQATTSTAKVASQQPKSAEAQAPRSGQSPAPQAGNLSQGKRAYAGQARGRRQQAAGEGGDANLLTQQSAAGQGPDLMRGGGGDIRSRGFDRQYGRRQRGGLDGGSNLLGE